MLKSILKWTLKVLFQIKVRGNVNSLKQENIIITPNHVSFLDGIILAVFLPVRPIFAIYSGYANHWLVRFAKRYVDFVPMDPLNPLSIKALVRAAEKGQPVVIFPEGRITITGSLMKIYDGAAFVATKSNSTIIPIWIDGAEFSITSRLKGIFKQKLFPKITIHIAEPEKLKEPETNNVNEQRRILGIELHKIMMRARMQSRPKVTLFDSFIAALVKFKGKTPLIQDPKTPRLSYRKLLLQTLGLGFIFESKTKEKDRVGVLLPNSVFTVSTILGLTLKNRIPAMLNYTAGTAALQCAVDIAQVKKIITSRQFLAKGSLNYLTDELKNVEWIYLEDLKGELPLSQKCIIYLAHFFPRFIKRRYSETDEAVILFTSGSEGMPKGVVHTHSSILANVEQIRSTIDPMPTDHFMSTLPLFHAFGLTAGMLLPILSGSKTFLYPNPLQYKIVPEIIYDQNCTVLFGTPTFLSNYAKYAHPYDFMQLRYVVAGAEKLSDATRNVWRDKFGIRILEGYGVTECAPVISLNVPMGYKAGTVGQLMPGMQSHLIPVEGIDNGGRLLIKGPNLMQGYLLPEKPGKAVFPHAEDEMGQQMLGWYDTGDIVEIDNDGFVIIKGRLKRFAKIGGEMVSLESVENMARLIDPEETHGATVKSDPSKGEAIVLFTTSNLISREALNDAAKTLGLPSIAIPREIRKISGLPLLGSGKTDYTALKVLAEST